MAGYRKWVDELPMWAKILLAIFVGPIIFGLYRIAKGDTGNIILGIAWILTGGLVGVGALIDLIFIIMKRPLWEL